MIETSTPETNSSSKIKVESEQFSDELGEDEASFYSSVRPNLNALIKNPADQTIHSILNYSKSL